MADLNSEMQTASFGGLFPAVNPPSPNSLSAFAEARTLKRDPLEEVLSAGPTPSYDPVSVAAPASPSYTPAPYFIRSSDPMQLDPDPFGEKTIAYGKRTGQNLTDEDVQGLTVFGRPMSREYLLTSDAGRRLLELSTKKRKGVKRDFWEALTDFSVSDLPFVSLIATVGGSIADAVQVSDTFKKMQNGEEVSDDDLVKTRLYLEENEYRSNGTWGSTVGDIVRAAPGFMTEFFATGGIFSAARGAATASAKAGSSFLLSRAAKMVAAELAEDGAKKQALKKFGKVTAENISKALGDSTFKSELTEGVTKALTNPSNGLLMGNPLLRDWSVEAIEKAAADRAATEVAKVAARNAGSALNRYFQSSRQWFCSNVSKALIDYGSFGTEEATKAFTGRTSAGRALADAVGDFFVKAPVMGSAMMATHTLTNPLIGAVAGKDGRMISGNALSLQASAWSTDNKYLMENAESMALGMDLLEFVSESAGSGFGSLLRAGGLGLEKLGIKGLVRPVSQVINDAGDLLTIKDAGVTIGGKMRQFIQKTLGTPQEIAANIRADEAKAVASVLGATDPMDLGYIKKMVTTRSLAGVPSAIAERVGPDVGKFVDEAVKKGIKDKVDGLVYKNFGRFVVANYMAKHNIGADTITGMFNRMGYDGVLGEMFEERYSDVAKGLLGLDEEKSHDFQFSDFADRCKKAIKGFWPGFDQLLAEAVGFSVPLVTQIATRKAIAKIGGTDKFNSLRVQLSGIGDALRVPIVEVQQLGQMQRAHDMTIGRLATEASEARANAQKERDVGNEEAAQQYEHQAEMAELESNRRQARHAKIIESIPEAARSNAEYIIANPILQRRSYRLPEEQYNLITVPTVAQAAEAAAAQDTLVGLAPELARQVANLSMEDGVTHKHLRFIARKLVGMAGAIVSGDFSLVRANPVEHIAEEAGLSRLFVNELANRYKETFKEVKDDIILNPSKYGLDAEEGNPIVERKFVEDATDMKFAETARRLMQSVLVNMNLRRFSQSDMKEQAVSVVARSKGYEVDLDRQRVFKFSEDTAQGEGANPFSDEATFDSFVNDNKEAIEAVRDQIAIATTDLLTNGMSSRIDDYNQIQNVVRLPNGSEILPAAIYEAALRMAGFSKEAIHTQRLQEDVPIDVLLESSSVGKVNLEVAHYVATKRATNTPIDNRAYEALASSLGYGFDGSEKGLKVRNKHIDTICDILETIRDPNAFWFAKEIPLEDLKDQFDRGGRLVKQVRLMPNGKYKVTTGYDQNGLPIVEEHDTLEEFENDGWKRTEQKIVITTKSLIESSDLYLMLRNLGMLGDYREVLVNEGAVLHPEMRDYSEEDIRWYREHYNLPEDITDQAVEQELAKYTLRHEIALASYVKELEGQYTINGDIPQGETKESLISAYDKVFGKHGYMTVGENLFRRNGGDTRGTLETISGSTEFQKIYRYNMSVGNRSLSNEKIYVPIDVSQSEDFVTGLIHLALRQAYANHRGLLTAACENEFATFAGELRSLIADKIKDKNTTDDIRNALMDIQRSILFLDRTTLDENGKSVTVRGAGLTLQTWTNLASAFALFQDKRWGLAGIRMSPQGQAYAAIADDVRQLPSFMSFLNLVDLSLGGNGFLSEAMRNKKEKPDKGSLIGIRRVLSAVSNNSDSFREAVKMSLPLGVSYQEFLDSAVRAAERLTHNPIKPSESTRPTKKYNKLTDSGISKLQEIIARPDSIDKIGDFFKELYLQVGAETLGDFNTFIDGVLSGISTQNKETLKKLKEQADKISSSIDDYNVKIGAQQELLKKLQDLYKDLEAVVVTDPVSADQIHAKVKALEDQLKAESSSANASSEEIGDRAGLNVQASVQGGDSSVPSGDSTPVTMGGTSNADQTGGDQQESEDSGEDEFSVEGLPEAPGESAVDKVLTKQSDTEEAALDSVLSKDQAKLGLNVALRALNAATKISIPTEKQVRDAVRRMFPSISEADESAIIIAFQQMDRERESKGLTSWEGMFDPGARWSFNEDETDNEGSTLEDSYNQRAVNLYNQQGMSDFLALANIAVPETGRNIQAFFSSVRDTLGILKMHLEDIKDYDGSKHNAIGFLDNLINPQANLKGKDYNQRRAYYANTLAKLDDISFTESLLETLMGKMSGYGSDPLSSRVIKGDPFFRKAAVIVSYLSALPLNLRRKFSDLMSESVTCTGIHVVENESNDVTTTRVEESAPRSYELKDSIISGALSPLLGLDRRELDIFQEKLGRFCNIETIQATAKKLGKTLHPYLKKASDEDLVTLIMDNAPVIGEVLSRVLGVESPLVSVLTSSILFNRVNHELAMGAEGIRHQALGYFLGVPSTGEISLIHDLKSVAEALKQSIQNHRKNPYVTFEDLRNVSVALFSSGAFSARKGGVFTQENDPGKLGAFAYLFRTYTDGLPVTITRAETDQERDPGARPSIALASPGVVPIVRRFMDLGKGKGGFYDLVDGIRVRLLKGELKGRDLTRWGSLANLFLDNSDFEVYKQLTNREFSDPEKQERMRKDRETFERILAECRQTLTWPNITRTPILAKNLSKSLTAAEFYIECAKAFWESDGRRAFWVPIYSGDHDSSVIFQLPRVLAEPYFGKVKELKLKAEAANKPVGEFTHRAYFENFARAMYKALGMEQMFDDTKRSTISSLSAPGVSTIGVIEGKNGDPDQFGEYRVHIAYNYDLSPDKKGPGAKALKDNEALFGTTVSVGYGVEQFRSRAKDPNTCTLKFHVVGTSGWHLYFNKALSNAFTEAGGLPLEGDIKRLAYEYLKAYRKGDPLASVSTDTFTDKDSYKMGIANSKTIKVVDADGKQHTILDYICAQLKAEVTSGTKVKMDAAAIDARFGQVKIFNAITGETTEHLLSDLLPAIDIRTIEGANGPTVSVSYAENGATLFDVANVSHKCQPKSGRTPRNNEVDALTMAFNLMNSDSASPSAKLTVNRYLNMLASWGEFALAINQHPAYAQSIFRMSQSIRENLAYGESPDGVFNREELFRALSAKLAHDLPLPIFAVDAPLTSSGDTLGTPDEPGYRFSVVHSSTSAMKNDLMRGSIVFATGEKDFYKESRRLALSNANIRQKGVRYGWFLNDEAFAKAVLEEGSLLGNAHSDAVRTGSGLSKEQITLVTLENAFTVLRDQELIARNPTASKDAKESAVALIKSYREQIASVFTDHHGIPIASRTYDYTFKGVPKSDPLSQSVLFEDLFIRDPEATDDNVGSRVFDRTAIQIEGDKVTLDSDGKKHIFLGGSTFGIPRTPSYNGGNWLQVSRLGLPVTETETKGSDGTITYTVGKDALVEPDPFTNYILGSDHDGDKAKLYLLKGNGGYKYTEGIPPSISPNLIGSKDPAYSDYVQELYRRGFVQRKAVDSVGNTYNVDKASPPVAGEWLEITDGAKDNVSNSFVRNLFDMARDLPCETQDTRSTFAGNLASRETKASPLEDSKSLINIADAFGAPAVVSTEHRLDDPWTAALVSTYASDANKSRGIAVSLAKTLHYGYILGQGSLNLDPVQWYKFIHIFDGIANGTFDDIKAQICYRLGWTSGMMNVLTTDLLLNRNAEGKKGDHPVLTDSEARQVIEQYTKGIYGALHNEPTDARAFMADLTDPTKTNVKSMLRKLFRMGKYLRSPEKDALMVLFGVVEKQTENGVFYLDVDIKAKNAPFKTVALAILNAARDYKKENPRVTQTRALNWLVDGNFRARAVQMAYTGWLIQHTYFGNRAVTNNEIAYFNFEEAQLTPEAQNRLAKDAKEFVEFMDTYSDLSKLQTISNALNYPSADPGDVVKFRKAAENQKVWSDFLTEETDERKISEATRSFLGTLNRMANITSNIYQDHYGLPLSHMGQRSVLNAEDDAFDVSPHLWSFVSKTLGTIPTYDNMHLRRNASQVPFVIAALLGLGDRKASNPFKGGMKNLKALRAIADAVGNLRKNEDPNNPQIVNPIFDLLRGIESTFRLIARVTGASREAVMGDRKTPANNALFYLQTLKGNSLYPASKYGVSADGMTPIVSAFSGGSDSALKRVQDAFDSIRAGFSFAKPLVESRVPGQNLSKPLDPNLTLGSLTELEKYLKGGVSDSDEQIRKDIAIVKAILSSKDLWEGIKEPAITPAMLTGQLLPFYSVLTQAPRSATQSTSLLQLTATYRGLSEVESLLSRYPSVAKLINILIGCNWNPKGVRRNEKQTEADLRKRWGNQSGSIFDVFAADEDGYSGIEEVLKQIDKVKGKAEYYNSQGSMRVLADYGRVLSDSPFEKIYRGKYQKKAGQMVAAMRELLGSWANVEYFGGSTFVIHGALRGNLGHGKYAVITVNVDGTTRDFINDEETLNNLASSRSFANSLCNTVDLGITANEFLALPVEVRKQMVKSFGIGGVCSRNISTSVDNKILSAVININNLATTSTSTVYHEYFHAMYNLLDKMGLFSEQDLKDLKKAFPNSDGSFNSELAAETFRKWVIKQEDPHAKEVRGIFQRIYDFVKGLLDALTKWFRTKGYETDEIAPEDTPLFKVVLSGIAEASPSKREELKDPRLEAMESSAALETTNILRQEAAMSKQSLDQFAADQAMSFITTELEKINPGKSEGSLIPQVLNILTTGENYDNLSNLLQEIVAGRRATNKESELLRKVSTAGENKALDFAVNTTEIPNDVPPQGHPAEPLARLRMAVQLATIPVAETSPGYRLGDRVVEGILNDLADHGSWKKDLDQCQRYMANQIRRDLAGADAHDHNVVLAGLRTAGVFVNPNATKLTKEELAKEENKAVFEAALIAERSMVRKFVESDQSYTNTGRGTTGRIKRVSGYQVAGFFLATRRVAPSEMARVSGDHIRTLLQKEGLGEPTKKALTHLAQQMAKLEAMTDGNGLIDFVRSGGEEKLDDIVKSITAGMKKIEFDADGDLTDPQLYTQESPSGEPEYEGSANPYSPDNYERYNLVINEPIFKDAYKTAVQTVYAVIAMNKFYRDLGVVPGSIRDVEAARMLSRGSKAADPDAFAKELAALGIGPTTVLNNESLVDYYSRSGFIGANTEEWINSHIRSSFGKVPLREVLVNEGHHEFAEFYANAQRFANLHAFLLGDAVLPGSDLHAILEKDVNFAMQFGEVKYRDGDNGKVLNFDNYSGLRGKRTNVQFTDDEFRVVDFFKKMLAAYANNQKFIITGVNDIRFNGSVYNDRSHYAKDYINKLWNNGAPERPFNKFQMALIRIQNQLDFSMFNSTDHGNTNLYDRFVNEVLEANLRARSEFNETPDEQKGTFDWNDAILKELEKRHIVATHKDAHGKRLSGALIIPVDFVNDAFKKSTAYEKLTSKEGGRKPEWLERDTLVKESLSIYRKMIDFVRMHPWLTEGDGRMLNSFRTPLMFFGGSGVFMADAVKTARDRTQFRTQALPRYAEAYRGAVNADKAGKALTDDNATAVLDFIGDVFRTPERGMALLQAIEDGKYAEGSTASDATGLTLAEGATFGDAAEAIYKRLLDLAWDEQMNKKPSKFKGVEEYIRIYEDERGASANIAIGGLGMDDLAMFERYGILPASMQLDHKICKSMEQIAGAMSMRATLINFLMTPAADGAPVFFAKPSSIAREPAGKSIPDQVWGEIARWWAEYYNVSYDESLDGIANAEQIYDKIRTVLDKEKGNLKGHRYTALGDNENDLISVTGWWAMNDENLGEDSSMINALAGGEAMGYLRQLIQSPRACWGLGGAGFRHHVQRALSWSKSLSVSFSFFFPIATRYESPIGAVGSIATLFGNSEAGCNWLREHPEFAKALQGWMPGSGWITKDFLGVSDVLQMMDSHDPFLADLISWASALGISISDRFVNPMEPTKSFVIEDVKRLKECAKQLGSGAAKKISAALDQILSRQGEKAFSYVLNATKLAIVAQMAQKLRFEAQKRGKAFDPIRDLRRYSNYINAEAGGINPQIYAWATPRHRSIMNALLFSWEWTRGAWEAGGGTVIEDFLFGGRSATKEERKFFLGRWARMFGAAMLGVPALFQIVCKALGIALGHDDDDDKWFTWQNEDKSWLSAFDLTPLLKGLAKFDEVHFDGKVARWKKDNPLLGTLIPMYTGNDKANLSTQQRHYYMHFGKQGWEFFRWFFDWDKQFFSKLSMPLQRTLEGVLGRNLSFLEQELPFEDQGVWERWLNPTVDGATFNLCKAFMPFSITGLSSFGDAGMLPIFGPVSMGASRTAINDRLVAALTKWANNDKAGYSWSKPKKGKTAKYNVGLVSDILEDARRNGVDPKEAYDKALGQVTMKVYSQFFNELPSNPDEDFDVEKLARLARTINRLGVKRSALMQSVKDKLKRQGRDWKSVLTPNQRAMYKRIIGEVLTNPYDTNEERFREPPTDY